MSGRCHKHGLDFGWTCPACEAAWEYMGRTHLLDAFDAGVRGRHYANQQVEYQAAWKHGQQYAKDGNKRDNNSEEAKRASQEVEQRKKSGSGKNKKKRHKASTDTLQPEGEVFMAKRATAAPTSTSFDQMLGASVTTAAAAKKRGAKPEIKLNKAESASLVKFLEAKKAYKEAESEMRLLEVPLLEKCINQQDTDGMQADFHGSYSVITEDGAVKATFVTQDKFSVSQDEENIEELRVVLGVHFEKEVVKTPTVTLKPEVFQDEELKAELVKLVGDKFPKFFQTVVRYSMKEGFAERIYQIAGTMTKLIRLRMLCGKAKPYIK